MSAPTAGSRSEALFDRANALIPGGVNSPVRAFGAVGGRPFFVAAGAGAELRDVDGRAFIDYVQSWGALMLGHAAPEIVDAVREAAGRGTSFGAPCPAEVELAELVTRLVPSVEKVRFTNSGTEATMSALRLARGATGRDLVLKFEGCYHGHGNSFLVQAGSGVATLGLPDSPGVPAALAKLTLTAPYNDLDAVRDAFAAHGDGIAAVILEPVVGNAGFIPPVDGFLAGLREVCTDHGALLIFDEVMTGFRVALGGAQERFGVMPDLTTLGKVVGGGLPVGAFGGPASLMDRVAPVGPVYQAGTLSGNPLAMAAGLAQVRALVERRPHADLERRGRRLVDGLVEAAGAAGIAAWGDAMGGMWGVHLRAGPVRDFADARGADGERFARFFRRCLEGGVFFAPSPFEAGFLTLAHTDAHVERTLEVAREAFAREME
ncbi:MAG TPA: glutamate-1-semialdehyde 2,1-aminomutase [Longimicrobiales bacterium]|nr:glutamate-1-semialdehyde 2,1-aminomutase [Longimicrobiales bacterium]